MHDIRDGDLRFRSEEAAAMLEAQGVRLTHTQLNRLHSLTEGWAAGLGLAAASLRTGRDADDFITSFAGDTGAMAGYLIEEVLAGLDDPSRDQGFVVPKGIVHRTRAPERAVILMVENAGIVPTGDA